jgi:tape measure domain-containing protein
VLEGRLSQLHDRFTKINAAAARVTAPFQGHIKALEQMNRLLTENARLLNQQAQAVSRVARSSGGSRAAAAGNPAVERERTQEMQRQLQLLRERARMLNGNSEVMAKLLRAEVEIGNSAGKNVAYGKELLKNAKAMLLEEERRARTVEQAAAKELRDKQAIWNLQAKALAEQERLQAKLANQRVADAAKVARAEEAAAKKAAAARGNFSRGAMRMGGSALGAIDGALGNPMRAVKNGAIRAGVGLAGVGALGGIDAAMSRISELHSMLGSSAGAPVIGGLAKGLAEFTQINPVLQSVTHSLAGVAGGSAAAVAAFMAFAPLLPSAGKQFGNLAEKIDKTTGASQKIAGALLSAQMAMKMAFTGGMDIQSLTGGPAMDLGRKSGAFEAKLGMAMLPKIAEGLVQSAMAEAEAADKIRAARASWVDVLEEGKAIQKDLLSQAQQEMRQIRANEQAASDAARGRLAEAAKARGTVFAPGKYPGMGDAGLGEFGPGGLTGAANAAYRTEKNLRSPGGQEAQKAAYQQLAQIEMALDRQVLDAKVDLIQRGLQAEIAAIDKATAHEKAQFQANLADFDKRLESRVARKEKQDQGLRGMATGAGIGLSMANIPGASIVQAASIAQFAGGGPAAAAVAGVTALGVAAVQAGGQIAKFYAEIQKSETALLGVSTSAQDYQNGIKGIEEVAKRLNLPLLEATQQFTSLRAAMAASGYDANETRTVFENLAAANVALGGDSQKLAGILLATSQVFSKGKVQAEELRGQIGERLAGAFSEFARATGRTAQGLDAALEKGEVTLQDFIAFTEWMGKKYGDTADKMAKDGSNAGQRLQNAWDNLRKAMGPILAAMGAQIQDWATKAVNALIPLINKINELMGMTRGAQNDALYALNKNQLPEAQSVLAELERRGAKSAQPGSYLAEQYQQQKEMVSRLQQQQKELQSKLYPKAGNTPVDKPTPTTDTGDADKELKKRLADEKRAAEALAKDQLQLDKQLASNAIELDNQEFQNRQELIRQTYELERQLQDKQRANWVNSFTGGKRQFAQIGADLVSGRAGDQAQLREIDMKIAELDQQIKAAKAGVAVAGMGGAVAAAGGVGGGFGRPIEYLTGDRSSSGYRADHGGNNYHEHIAYATAKEARAAAELLNRNGIRTTELKGVNPVGGHSQGSYHYSGQAFDVPAAQVPVGQEQALSQRVRALLGIGGAGRHPAATSALGGAAEVLGAQGNVQTLEAQKAGLLQQKSGLQQGLSAQDAERVKAAVLATTNALREQTAELGNNAEALQLRHRLEMEGVRPEQVEAELKKLEVSRQLTDAQTVYGDMLKNQLIDQAEYNRLMAELQTAAQGAAGAIDQLTQAQIEANDPINQKIKQLQTNLGDTRGMIASLAGTVESEVGSAMSNAITGIIDGTSTVQEAFSQMFKNIGKAFIDMATQMLAQQMVLGILKMFGGAVAGGVGGGASWGGSGGSAWGGFVGAMSMPSFFAEGGFVTGPTPAVVGEGGSNEYVVPENKMGSALARWNSGMRGDAVLSGADPTGSASEQGDAPGAVPSININGGVLNFDGSQYIKASELPSIVSQASKAGEARTLRRLQMSSTTRSKIGMA